MYRPSTHQPIPHRTASNHPAHHFQQITFSVWMVLILLLLTGLACSETPALVSSSQHPDPSGVLFRDDFSQPSGVWGTWSRDGGTVDYRDGGLRIQVNQTQFDYWSVAGKNFSDVQIEVDATKTGGPDDNDFGVICRYKDQDNFYMTVISSDGYYGIAKMKEGQYYMIGSEELQYSDAIAKGQVKNHLLVTCVGSTLSLSVNGQKLMDVQDADFASGDLGVMAGAYDILGVEVLFDNFMVKKPSG